ncbi:MAG: hypothetical protein PHY12_09305, partial [Eubacteriales bacterium]|nr:hypothetical protein [Eubacteriales bacterium]
MNAELRVSVRELVGFTYFPPDIMPGRDTEELLAGTLAHQGRQRAQADQFEIEKSVKRTFDREGARITVFGRMDAFRADDPPLIEEIKHCAFLPDEALPEHRVQALLYAAMMARELDARSVRVRVAYVDERGELLRAF